jgi:hypothetical protein
MLPVWREVRRPIFSLAVDVSTNVLTKVMFVFRYMAPEVILACPGGKPHGRKVDVFSFSVILWELATLEKQ